MIAKCFKIKCLTNMHVGNGDVNFSIIDNEVERDPVTGFPTINASGVKGALRMFFETEKSEKDLINNIFGKSSDNNEEINAGKIKFFSANMFALPMRASDGKAVYYLVTNQTAIDIFKNLGETLNVSLPLKAEAEKNTLNGIEAEGKKLIKTVKFDNEEIYIMNKAADFQDVSLPVVARNKLENGISTQLWYEEIVPHESIFYFFAAVNDCDEKLLKMFEEKVNNKVIQFGGNASIGCGFCKVTMIGDKKNEQEKN